MLSEDEGLISQKIIRYTLWITVGLGFIFYYKKFFIDLLSWLSIFSFVLTIFFYLLGKARYNELPINYIEDFLERVTNSIGYSINNFSDFYWSCFWKLALFWFVSFFVLLLIPFEWTL